MHVEFAVNSNLTSLKTWTTLPPANVDPQPAAVSFTPSTSGSTPSYKHAGKMYGLLYATGVYFNFEKKFRNYNRAVIIFEVNKLKVSTKQYHF